MEIDFRGHDEQVVTFECDESVQAGTFVEMCANNKVTKANRFHYECTHTGFIGLCVAVRNGYAAIQLRGYVEAPSKEKIPLSYQKLAVTKNNEIVLGDDIEDMGNSRLVVFSNGKTVGFIL